MSWPKALEILRSTLSEEDIERWIAPLKSTIEKRTLVLWAPNSFVTDKVTTDFHEDILAACKGFADKVVYRVGEPTQQSLAPTRSAQVSKPPALLKSIWNEDSRGLPADFARSALFESGRYNEADRPSYVAKEIFAQSNMRMTHTGPAVTYADEDVYLAVLHLARGFPFGEEIRFSLRDLASALDLSASGPSLKSIEERLQRLHLVKIELEVDSGGSSRTYSGYLISSFLREQRSGTGRGQGQMWTLKIDETLTRLLTPNLLTVIQWDMRKSLSGGAAKRLQAYYASFSEPFPVKLETLVKLCGLNAKSDRKNKQSVVDALDQLVSIGFLQSWIQTSGDLIKVKKPILLEG